MQIHDITKAAGAHKRRMRVGRGESSGKGKTSGRGDKGCQSRSGGGVRPLTMGGALTLARRFPKVGFSNYKFETRYDEVNLLDLEKRFEAGATVDVDVLRKAGLVSGRSPMVKILAKGALTKKLMVEAHAFSASAKAAIEQAGGEAKLIEQIDKAAAWKAKRRTKALEKRARIAKLRGDAPAAGKNTPSAVAPTDAPAATDTPPAAAGGESSTTE